MIFAYHKILKKFVKKCFEEVKTIIVLFSDACFNNNGRPCLRLEPRRIFFATGDICTSLRRFCIPRLCLFWAYFMKLGQVHEHSLRLVRFTMTLSISQYLLLNLSNDFHCFNKLYTVCRVGIMARRPLVYKVGNTVDKLAHRQLLPESVASLHSEVGGF